MNFLKGFMVTSWDTNWTQNAVNFNEREGLDEPGARCDGTNSRDAYVIPLWILWGPRPKSVPVRDRSAELLDIRTLAVSNRV